MKKVPTTETSSTPTLSEAEELAIAERRAETLKQIIKALEVSQNVSALEIDLGLAQRGLKWINPGPWRR